MEFSSPSSIPNLLGQPYRNETPDRAGKVKNRDGDVITDPNLKIVTTKRQSHELLIAHSKKEFSNQESLVKILIDQIDSSILKEYPTTGGVLLACNNHDAWKYLADLQSSILIGSIPLDERKECYTPFRDYITWPIHTGDYPVLCCCDSDGTGKSLLQALNMMWFGNFTNGIAITVSLKQVDDWLFKHEIDYSLEEVLAILVVQSLFTRYRENTDVESLLSPKSGFGLWEAIISQEHPLEAVLTALPLVLKAPLGTKIFLSIDDTNLCHSYGMDMDALHVCTALLLSGKVGAHGTLPFAYVSLVFDNVFDLTRYLQLSKRHVKFQSLSPLFIHSGLNPHQMPPILRPFFKKEMKRSAQVVTLGVNLAQLFAATGGHPGRLSVLLHLLRQCSSPSDDDTESFCEWLDESRIAHLMEAMNNVHRFPVDDFQSLCARFEPPMTSAMVINMLPVETCEQLQVNREISMVGHGNQLGYWSITQLRGLRKLFPVITWPVLAKIPSPPEINLQGNALLQLRDACIECYHLSDKCQDETAMAKMVLAALLHYSFCNYSLELSNLCQSGHHGWRLLRTVKLGTKVQHWKQINEFPFATLDQTVDRLEEWFGKLIDEDSPAAFFIPTDEPTCVVGLFLAEDINTVLVIQTKDWHWQDGHNKLDLNKDWRVFEAFDQELVRCKMLKGKGQFFHELPSEYPVEEEFPTNAKKGSKLKKRNSKSKRSPKTVKCLSSYETILKSAERIEEVDVECLFMTLAINDLKPIDSYFRKYAANQGAGTIKSLRNLVPTAAYALENAANLHVLFC